MDLGIAGRVAMVAASSKGIGRAVAASLLAEGCRVSICSRTADEIEAAREEMAAAAPITEVFGARCESRDEELKRAAARLSASARGHRSEHGRSAAGAFRPHEEQWRQGMTRIFNVIGCRARLPASASESGPDST